MLLHISNKVTCGNVKDSLPTMQLQIKEPQVARVPQSITNPKPINNFQDSYSSRIQNEACKLAKEINARE